MAYDSESDHIILWGAGEVGRTPMSEEEKATVWSYDYETNTWSAIESAGGPSLCSGHTMVHHPGTDRIILFGGYHLGDADFSDGTWPNDMTPTPGRSLGWPPIPPRTGFTRWSTIKRPTE